MLVAQNGPSSANANALMGKAAIANARLAYDQFLHVFSSDQFMRLATQGSRKQRPLWASTSTKNPAYRDVIYIEELIGPDTVNTTPPQTLDAFRDHGKARLSITENVSQADQDLAALEELGIHMSTVTTELEVEGVKAFSDAITALLKTIEERRVGALAQPAA